MSVRVRVAEPAQSKRRKEVNPLTEQQIQEQLEELMDSLACLDAEDVEDEVETATRASFW